MLVVPAVTATEEGRLNVEYGNLRTVCKDSAIQQGDMTYLPVRDVFSALGGIELSWAKDEAEDKIIFSTAAERYQLVIDFANDQAMGVDKTYPMINVNHKIYLPVNFYADVLGCNVEWEKETSTLVVGESTAVNSVAVVGEKSSSKVRLVNLPAYEMTTVSRASGVGLTYYQEGNASWYGSKFHGRRTASGEVFDANALTAAHPTLPFGTIVRVTSLSNGASVDVRINDRGPYTRGRIIDLSQAAAAQIGLASQGVGAVKLEIVE